MTFEPSTLNLRVLDAQLPRLRSTLGSWEALYGGWRLCDCIELDWSLRTISMSAREIRSNCWELHVGRGVSQHNYHAKDRIIYGVDIYINGMW